MSYIITKRIEIARGCGYRKPGGFYFVSDGIGAPCCKLPFPLTVCPCCGAGFKQVRGFTWINSDLFAGGNDCTQKEKMYPFICPMRMRDKRMGLLWVGEKYYPTADHFTREANMLGVSKRFAQLPNDFVLGETWICLAHAKAVSAISDKGELTFAPGIFRAFKPSRIEYIVIGHETPEQLEALTKRGFTLVKVIRDIDAQTSLL